MSHSHSPESGDEGNSGLGGDLSVDRVLPGEGSLVSFFQGKNHNCATSRANSAWQDTFYEGPQPG
jgi:hypothetical protein